MHCASLGEFEQGRPVLEAYRLKYPEHCIVLSFFSPSGYERCKSYAQADLVCYLPLDSPSNAQRFIDAVHPDLVLFVKYEFWYFYLRTLHERSIKTWLIAAHFRPGQIFFKWYGILFKELLTWFDHIYLQYNTSLPLLEFLPSSKVSVVGDPRVDRVLQIKAAGKSIPTLANWIKDCPCVYVLASVWESDLPVIKAFVEELQENERCIIVPHEPSMAHISAIQAILPAQAALWTHNIVEIDPKDPLLIVDAVGLLSNLYQYAHIVYVGGGFGQGVHNLLEPAVWSLPVVFGPKHQKFPEATALIQAGAGFCIQGPTEIPAVITKLKIEQPGPLAGQLMERLAGATSLIVP